MRHVPIFRVARLSVAVALLTALAIPGVASADPPSRFTETVLSLECPLIVTGDGAISTFVISSDQGFSEAGLAYWTEEPLPDSEEPPLLDGFTDQVTVGDLAVAATFPLLTIERVEAGTATIDATLVPIGEPEPFESHSPHFRIQGTSQAASIEGTALIEAEGILPGPLSFDLSSCLGTITIQTIFEVHPGTLHQTRDQVRLSCELANPDATAFVFGFAFVFDGVPLFSFVGSAITPNDPAEPSVSGIADADLTAAGVDATWDLFSDVSGDQVGQASISADFDPIGVEMGRRVSQNFLEKVVITTMAVSGTLTAETGTATHEFDLSDCQASILEFHGIYHGPNGPKPGGAVPVNDTPEGAIPLAPGDKILMKTGGASVPPEEPCEFSLGRTVWFTIEGTGGPVTVDPTGSDFDTVVGAYVSGDVGLEPVGCVDDDSSRFQRTQGPLTFDTEVGTTYHVQVGGFDVASEFGLEPNPEFGLLKLAVR
jgi:hypothetical protein